jgi:hypothetical protein
VFDTVVPTIDETRPDGSFRVVFKPGGSELRDDETAWLDAELG